jgi:hypothetical protein
MKLFEVFKLPSTLPEAVEPVDFGGGVVDGCCPVEGLEGLGVEVDE